jgi:uncharacterized cysteine cluster protein YcgN (CxxCxxCC family)
MGEVKNLIVMSTPQGITECDRCGSCCRNIILKGNFSEEMKEWFQATSDKNKVTMPQKEP